MIERRLIYITFTLFSTHAGETKLIAKRIIVVHLFTQEEHTKAKDNLIASFFAAPEILFAPAVK